MGDVSAVSTCFDLGVFVSVVTLSLHKVLEGFVAFLAGVWQFIRVDTHVVLQVAYVYCFVYTALLRAFVYGTIVGFHVCSKLGLSHVFLVASYDITFEHGLRFMLYKMSS